MCGFANAGGGTIFIGVEDDGTPCGISNAKNF
ncbi:MAG: ATP-binding protein [Muribaculaceae bacterium]|nr:ATP-binding protein [Muribaculaceae bacterium]